MTTPFNSGYIYTDAKGRPIERPENPGENAPIEDKIAFMRAVHAYNDRVTDMANASFSKALSKALRS